MFSFGVLFYVVLGSLFGVFISWLPASFALGDWCFGLGLVCLFCFCFLIWVWWWVAYFNLGFICCGLMCWF